MLDLLLTDSRQYGAPSQARKTEVKTTNELTDTRFRHSSDGCPQNSFTLDPRIREDDTIRSKRHGY